MTVDDLLYAVQERMLVDAGGGKATEQDVLDAACWFVACHEAEGFLDGLRVKDVARLIVEGISLGGPLKTREDLEAWIKELNDADCTCPQKWNGHDEPTRDETRTEATCPVHGLVQDSWNWLDAALDRHFGITRRG